MILLLPVEGGSPLPVEKRVSPVAYCLPGEGARLAGEQRVVDGGPVHAARLRLHDPEVRTLPTTNEVLQHRILLAIEMPLSNVVIPAGKVQVCRDGVVVPIV